MILFKKTPYSDGMVNLLINWFGGESVDFIDGPYWAKMFVMCFYTVWVVMPFKILILTSALASVRQDYYNAAKIDGTSKWRIFTRITLPMISPMIFYLIINALRRQRRLSVLCLGGRADSLRHRLYHHGHQPAHQQEERPLLREVRTWIMT